MTLGLWIVSVRFTLVINLEETFLFKSCYPTVGLIKAKKPFILSGAHSTAQASLFINNDVIVVCQQLFLYIMVTN